MPENGDDTQNKRMAPTLDFMAGGGEMGERTRAYDWSKSVLGPATAWPQSLRTTISILLNSKSPMFLWWGEHLIQFYNDAYRPSLGNHGKHPNALGARGEDTWPEIWPVIKPLIERVQLYAEACYKEDQLIPIYRNGRLEDVYWTFGYSPVLNENGSVGGVLVICNETTRKVNALTRLQDSEQRFQNLMRETNTGIIVLHGREMRVGVVNEAYERLVGHTISKLIDKPIFDIIPEAEDPYRALLEKVYDSGESIDLKEQPYLIYGDEGKKEGFLNLVYQPYREANGKITGVLAMVVDVTEQVMIRQKLAASEARYRLLIEESPIAAGLYIGEALKIQYVNDIMLKYWGKDESVIGKALHEALPELEGQPFLGLMGEVYRSGKPYVGEREKAILEIDGQLQEFYFNYTYKPLFTADGNVYGVHHTAFDVTKEVLAQQQLETSAAELNKLANAMPQVVWIAEADGTVSYYNDRVAKFDEVTHSEDGSWQWEAGVHAEDLQPTIDAWNTAVREGTIYEIEHRIRMKNGSLRWHLSRAYPQYDEAGKVVKWYGTATDVHNQKVNEEILEQKNKQLQRTNNDLDNFIYTASHDLKAPISNIEGLLHALQRSLPTASYEDPKIQQITSMMEKSVERFKRTISNLTEVVKLRDENNGHAVFVKVDKVIQEVLLDLGQLIEGASAKFEVTVQDCPGIHFSEKNLRSVVYNLISNAIKYQSAERQPHIRISCQSTEEELQLQVQDNGLGMDKLRVGQLFTKFRRFHSHVEGAGIGLYIVKRIVDNAGGRIEVTSELNQGTTFKVYLKR